MDAFEAISLPEPSPITGKKQFTVAEANRSLVLVRRITTDLVNHYHKLRDLHNTYQAFGPDGEASAAEEARQEYVRITDQLSELREELEAVGCELRDFEEGLVDFPSVRNGREVYLCWKLGEPEVGHWHEVTAGFASRQPLNDLFG